MIVLLCCAAGAAFSYHPSERFWEAMEVRAFGLFLGDLVDRLDPSAYSQEPGAAAAPAETTPQPQTGSQGASTAAAKAALAQLVAQCTQAAPAERPRFVDVCACLGKL